MCLLFKNISSVCYSVLKILGIANVAVKFYSPFKRGKIYFKNSLVVSCILNRNHLSLWHWWKILAQELQRWSRQEEGLDEDAGERQELLLPVGERSEDVAEQEQWNWNEMKCMRTCRREGDKGNSALEKSVLRQAWKKTGWRVCSQLNTFFFSA